MVILDSSFLIAYHNRGDVHHPAAAAVMERLVAGEWGRALLLEYVIVEVATVLLVRRNLSTAVRVVDALLRAGEVEFLPCSAIFLATLDTFRNQQPSDLSFVDAAILTVARQRDVEHVATFDRDFAGLDGIEPLPEG